MAKYPLGERTFIFEMPDGSEIVGRPLTLGQDQELRRDGTWAVLADPAKHSDEEVTSASIRYLAASLRKDEAFVVGTFSAQQAGEALRVLLLETFPQKAEGDGGPNAMRP